MITRFGLAFAAMAAWGVSAQAVELRGPRGTFFDADVRLQAGAIGNGGKIDNSKVFVFVRPRQKMAGDVTVNAMLEMRTGGTWQMIGALGCHFGPLEKGQGSVYQAASCDHTPDPMYARKGRRLWVSVMVTFLKGATPKGATKIVRIPVGAYPPGMAFR